ncbi:MFS transporter [Corallococcus sp. H22C18031201]|uniref:MFS transporter n=1 Tax=Citreicoccus inhibens TaxID=2849499 RepID=UPI000E70FFBD|nr:MFS transporter [Citreicoccus inhibens]MBU8894220.1 MFS transporter [Citreicoccus inhibens]RJS23343.1 MFS transporter [Corallococcus sp. H22C18031201]
MRLPSSRLRLLCALYFVQGLPFGFQVNALPTYLRARGASLAAIGFLGLLASPWMAKALWAPLVDRYYSERIGRRKSWILPMQALLAGACVCASLAMNVGSLPLLLGCIFLMNLFAATQDIAVDGFAVDTLEPEELGLGNAAQVVGYKLGMMTGGGLLVWASAHIGWSGLFLAMAGLCLAVFAWVAAFREPPPKNTSVPTGTQRTWSEVRGEIVHALRMPGTGWLLLFVLTYKLGETMSDVIYKSFLIDSGYVPAQIGLLVGTWGIAASLIGSVAGGLLASRVPLLKAVAITGTLRLVPLAGRWLLAHSGVTGTNVIAVTLAEEFFGGALTTAMFAFMMSRVDPLIGATHYTLLASVETAGKGVAGFLGGWLADAHHGGWGYASVFMLGLVLSVGFLALLEPLRRSAPPAPTPAPAPQPSSG